MKRMDMYKQTRLVDMLEKAIGKQGAYVENLKGSDNPVVKEQRARCSGEAEAYRAVLWAIRDNNWSLIRIGAEHPSEYLKEIL